jgi:hypothetical protein
VFGDIVHGLLGNPESNDLQGREYVTFLDLDPLLDLNPE